MMGVVLAARWRDCYIRTAVSYRNEGVINQPAEPQQHSSSSAHLLPLYPALFYSSHLRNLETRLYGGVEARLPPMIYSSLAGAQSSSARVATFPGIVNFSKQEGRQ